jgi:ABC-type protease/lipase transport system fused ATPase/permease subunit
MKKKVKQMNDRPYSIFLSFEKSNRLQNVPILITNINIYIMTICMSAVTSIVVKNYFEISNMILYFLICFLVYAIYYVITMIVMRNIILPIAEYISDKYYRNREEIICPDN